MEYMDTLYGISDRFVNTCKLLHFAGALFIPHDS